MGFSFAACPPSWSKDTYLAAKYRRNRNPRGSMKAIVAIEHSILTASWRMLADGEGYTDSGADYFTRLDPMDNALEARFERLRHHFQRPIPGS